MSRVLSGKILLRGTLEAQCPISVNGAGRGSSGGLSLATNGAGNYYIPGTSLAGPLRHWLRTRIGGGETLVKALFGYHEGNEGHASYLALEDQVVNLNGALSHELRDGIQIDRALRTTRPRFKYKRHLLPRGVSFPIELELDLPASAVKGCSAEKFQAALGHLIGAMASDGLRLGSGKTRGFGRVKLMPGYRIEQYKFPDDLDKWLDSTPEEKNLVNASDLKTADQSLARDSAHDVDFTLDWNPVSPTMVKSGRDGNQVDILPLMSGLCNGRLSPVIPGSALKGVLRTHAGRILRSRRGGEPPRDGSADPDNLYELDVLFGSKDRSGILHVEDVYQTSGGAGLVKAKDWRAETVEAINAVIRTSDHVAIDGLTSGASDTALYNIGAPRSDRADRVWEPIRITLDFNRFVRAAEQARKLSDSGKKEEADNEAVPLPDPHALLTLLLFTLRDLKAGLVPIGLGTRRGMGEIQVADIKMKGHLAGMAFDTCNPIETLSEGDRKTLNEKWNLMVKVA